MAYTGTWDSTDQIPLRTVTAGLIPRFGALDPSDGGRTHRYSGSVEWQRSRQNVSTKISVYGIGYDLSLFSNFTFFLDDPVHGDQFNQTDHRFVTGAKLSHRRISRWAGREMQDTVGVQLRNDDITNVGLYHTEKRERLDTVRQDGVVETSAAAYAQNELAWSSSFRTTAGVRIDGCRFDVDSSDPANSGTTRAALVSPKGGVVVGPWDGTEFYANAGLGFHSNDARGTTITRDPSTGEPVDPVTPLVRAKGAEVGVRTVAVPHLQTSVAVWTLHLDSELIFVGDAGTTEAGRPSHRFGVEFANYYTPRRWLIIDADVAWSRSHFTDDDPAGDDIPGSLQAVLSGGATLDSIHNVFGSIRFRYFGPRPLIEDNSVRSKATSLVNLEAGYKLGKHAKISLDVFNLLDAADSDIDYYYPSRILALGEPAEGVEGVHFHPTLPRTARVNLTLGF